MTTDAQYAEGIDALRAALSRLPVFYHTAGEFNVRCPFCGDSRKSKRSAHLYIAERHPHPWFCMRCGAKNMHLTIELLRSLEAEEQDVAVYARRLSKDHQLTAKRLAARGGGAMYVNIPPMDPSDPLDRRALDYLADRLGSPLTEAEQKRYKVFRGLRRLMEANGVEVWTGKKRPEEQDRLDRDCLGFVSADGTYAIMRTVDPDYQGRRYTNYQIFPDLDGSKVFLVRKPIDVAALRHRVVISEGAIDLIGIERGYHAAELDDPAYVGAACNGSGFGPSLRWITSRGILSPQTSLYMDNEPGNDFKAWKALDEANFAGAPLSTFEVWTNGLGKDFGVRPDQHRRDGVRRPAQKAGRPPQAAVARPGARRRVASLGASVNVDTTGLHDQDSLRESARDLGAEHGPVHGGGATHPRPGTLGGPVRPGPDRPGVDRPQGREDILQPAAALSPALPGGG